MFSFSVFAPLCTALHFFAPLGTGHSGHLWTLVILVVLVIGQFGQFGQF